MAFPQEITTQGTFELFVWATATSFRWWIQICLRDIFHYLGTVLKRLRIEGNSSPASFLVSLLIRHIRASLSPPLSSPLPALIAHSPRLPRYFSHCLHLLRLITLFFSLSSPAVYRSLPSLVPPSLFFLKCAPLLPLSSSPSVSCIFFPPVCPFIPLTLLLCLITRPLPLHFHSLSPLLHAVVLCLPACLPACLSIP